MDCGKSRRAWLRMLGAGLLMLTAACDRGPKRYHVSGQVYYDGKPVPAGEIYFDPDVTKGHDGTQGFARIKDGQYDTRVASKGVAPGPHIVRILGFDGKVPPGEDLPFGKPLFTEYKTTADIGDQGDATLDFKVPGRGR